MKKYLINLVALCLVAGIAGLTPQTALAQTQKEQWQEKFQQKMEQRKNQQKKPKREQKQQQTQPGIQRASATSALLSYAEIPDFFDTEIPVGESFTDNVLETDLYINPLPFEATGKGYWFEAEAGKSYKIAFEFTTEGSFNEYAGVYLLRSGELTGDWDDDIEFSYEDKLYDTQVFSRTLYFSTHINGPVRLLVSDEALNAYSFTITIEETETVHYTDLEYEALELGKQASGTFKNAVDMDGLWGNVLLGKGYSIEVEEGKTYKITAAYTAQQLVNMAQTVILLTDGELQGNWEDVINTFEAYIYGSELTQTSYYTADKDGALRILMFDWNGNNLFYTLEAKEEEPPAIIELAELLNKAKTMEHDGELAFVYNSEPSDLVEGNDYFGWQDDNFYASAYKITLAEDEEINMSLTKQSEPMLYIYKKENDEYIRLVYEYMYGGYHFSFTADEAGDYYIVVSDEYPYTGGSYSLKIWNTSQQPGDIVITGLSADKNSINFSKTPSESEILSELSKLILSGITEGGEPVGITNNIFGWSIDLTEKQAAYTPISTPVGYEFASNLQPLAIAINIAEEKDNADIANAKTLIESANYAATQANVTNITQAKEAVEAIISGLALNGVSTAVINGEFTAATAGTAENTVGTNGSYTFTVNISKGVGTEQTTKTLTLTITATEHTTPIISRENLLIGGIEAQTVRIYNLKGDLLMVKTIMPNETLSISHLPKGAYIARIGNKTYRMAR